MFLDCVERFLPPLLRPVSWRGAFGTGNQVFQLRSNDFLDHRVDPTHRCNCRQAKGQWLDR